MPTWLCVLYCVRMYVCVCIWTCMYAYIYLGLYLLSILLLIFLTSIRTFHSFVNLIMIMSDEQLDYHWQLFDHWQIYLFIYLLYLFWCTPLLSIITKWRIIIIFTQELQIFTIFRNKAISYLRERVSNDGPTYKTLSKKCLLHYNCSSIGNLGWVPWSLSFFKHFVISMFLIIIAATYFTIMIDVFDLEH